MNPTKGLTSHLFGSDNKKTNYMDSEMDIEDDSIPDAPPLAGAPPPPPTEYKGKKPPPRPPRKTSAATTTVTTATYDSISTTEVSDPFSSDLFTSDSFPSNTRPPPPPIPSSSQPKPPPPLLSALKPPTTTTTTTTITQPSSESSSFIQTTTTSTVYGDSLFPDRDRRRPPPAPFTITAEPEAPKPTPPPIPTTGTSFFAKITGAFRAPPPPLSQAIAQQAVAKPSDLQDPESSKKEDEGEEEEEEPILSDRVRERKMEETKQHPTDSSTSVTINFKDAALAAATSKDKNPTTQEKGKFDTGYFTSTLNPLYHNLNSRNRPLPICFQKIFLTVMTRKTFTRVGTSPDLDEPNTVTSNQQLNRIRNEDGHFEIDTPIERLTWWERCCRRRKRERVILDKLDGVFTPGRLTAILGASGCGKTSLLHVLGGQVMLHWNLMGTVQIGGERFSMEDKRSDVRLRGVSGFLPQGDLMTGTHTVREAIAYAAMLRMPDKTRSFEKFQRTENIIKQFGLEKLAETRVNALSEMDRRKVSVGRAMVTNPNILYLDDPLRGLDPLEAYAMMKTLRALCRSSSRDTTVVVAIAQPPSEIFHLIDDVMVLSYGRAIYMGPRDHLTTYLKKNGFHIPPETNPADYLFMNILLAQEAVTDDDLDQAYRNSRKDTKNAQRLVALWPTTPEYQEFVNGPLRDAKISELEELGGTDVASFSTQFWIVAKRAFIHQFRHKHMLQAKFLATMLVSFLIGIFFLQARMDQTGVQNRQGALWFMSLCYILNGMIGVLHTWQQEKAIFLREYDAGFYRLPAYFWSRLFVELPFKLIFPLLGSILMYSLIGLHPTGQKAARFIFGLVLLDNCGTAIGVILGCSFKDLSTAIQVIPAVFIPLTLFSGYLITNSSGPDFLDWIRYFSPIFYGYVALAKNEFPGLEFYCVREEMSRTPNGTYVCPFTYGDDVITFLDFQTEPSVDANLGILLVFYLVLIVASYFSLRRQLRKIKKRVKWMK